jgi:hypothetical protein
LLARLPNSGSTSQWEAQSGRSPWCAPPTVPQHPFFELVLPIPRSTPSRFGPGVGATGGPTSVPLQHCGDQSVGALFRALRPGGSRRFGHDSLSYFTERLDATVTRQAEATVLHQAKRNKAFKNSRFIGLALDGTAAVGGHTAEKTYPRLVHRRPKARSSPATKASPPGGSGSGGNLGRPRPRSLGNNSLGDRTRDLLPPT